MFDFEHILYERRGRVGILTLNRPEALNRLNLALRNEYKRALLEADADEETSAIVITGAGRAFCAGADLGRWQGYINEGDPGRRIRESAEEDEAMVPEIMARIKPVVAAINGDAVGAGITWVQSADYLVAAEGARISFRYAALGVGPQVGASRLTVLQVGWQRAHDLLLTGRFVPASEAKEIGLIQEVVPLDQLMDRALAKANEFAEIPPSVTRPIKSLMDWATWQPDGEAVKRRERELFVELSKGPAHAEAVRAFLERRRPDFYATGDRPTSPGQPDE